MSTEYTTRVTAIGTSISPSPVLANQRTKLSFTLKVHADTTTEACAEARRRTLLITKHCYTVEHINIAVMFDSNMLAESSYEVSL